MHPLSYPEEFTVEALLHWSEAARIDYEFIIRDGTGRIAATGYTVQLILDRNREVMMVPPPFLVAIREKWKAGELEAGPAPNDARTKLAERFKGP
jgi:acyl-CoA thioester hydrolase